MTKYALLAVAIFLAGCATTDNGSLTSALAREAPNPQLLNCGFNRTPVCRESGCKCVLLPYTLDGNQSPRMPVRRR